MNISDCVNESDNAELDNKTFQYFSSLNEERIIEFKKEMEY